MGYFYLKKMITTYFNVVYGFKRKKIKLDYLPPVIWVEPTNICNLKCAMCPNSIITKEETGYMKMEILEKIVDEFSSYYSSNTGLIALFLGGEPLINQDIFNMIDYARSKEINVNLATNATLLSKENIDFILKKPPTLLILSFDGYDEESYEKARKGAKFELTLENIIDLLNEKKRRGLTEPKVRLYSLILRTDKSEEERKRFIKFYNDTFRGLGVDEFLIENAGTWTGLFKKGGDSETFIPDNNKGDTFYPCIRLWDSMSILWNGSVVPCCADFKGKMVLGNVKTKRLIDIWNDKPYQNLRKKMIAQDINDIDLCSKECDSLYPTGVVWGLPGELQIHRKIMRDIKSMFCA